MPLKQCKGCLLRLPIEKFYRHQRMEDGHLNFCKDCVKKRIRKHRRDNDHVREYDRERGKLPYRRALSRAIDLRNRIKNPAAYRARYTLRNAVRDGRIKKKPCEVCRNIRSEGHHEDYSKPLEVRWLCSLHHHRLECDECVR